MSLDKECMVRTTVTGIRKISDIICSYYYVFGYYILNILFILYIMSVYTHTYNLWTPHTTWMQSQEDSCTERSKQEGRLVHKEPKNWYNVLIFPGTDPKMNSRVLDELQIFPVLPLKARLVQHFNNPTQNHRKQLWFVPGWTGEGGKVHKDIYKLF